MTGAQETRDLWQAALNTLDEDAKQRLTAFNISKLEVLNDILEAAKSKKAEALEGRWKFTHNGQTYIVRDYLEKIIVWVEKFKIVGDQAIQYDPAHAALPWACVRFFLQAAVDSVKTFGMMMENVGHISNIIARSAILEDLYLGKNLKISDLLENTLTRLYAKILGYLAKATKYYSSRTIKNVAKSVFADSSATQPISSQVDLEQNEIDRCVALADAELQELSDTEFDRTQSHQHGSLKKLFQELQDPIVRISSDMSQMLKLVKEADRIHLLKSISTIPYPSHHKTISRSRLTGSGSWLLQHPAFIDWRTSSSSTILWLHGMPGCGKTKLCSIVIDEMKLANSKEGSVEHIAFFYCARDPREPLRGQSCAVMQSILRQVVSMSPDTSIPLPAKQAYDEIQNEGFGEREWTKEECVETLIQIMEICPSVTIVIDALDECCEDERASLLLDLKYLRDRSANLIKIFISSRDDVDVFSCLADTSDIRIHAGDNSEDIGRFVSERVGSLMDSRNSRYGPGTPGLQKEIESVLRNGAQGMFRWVDLQLETLKRGKLDEDLRDQLGSLPHTLEESYGKIYTTIVDYGPHAKALADTLFQWLLYGKKMIQTGELAAFISLVTGASKVPLRPQNMLDICSNLVEIDPSENVFRFVHLSVREFFENYQKHGMTTFTRSIGNASLANCGLLYICFTLSPERVLNQMPEIPVKTDISSELASQKAVRQYVDNYWLEHAKLAGKDRCKAPFQPLFQFFFRKPSGADSIHEIWCRSTSFPATITHSHENQSESGLHLEKRWAAIRKPAHHIWIACAFDLDELVDPCFCDEPLDIEMKTGVHLTPLLEAARLGSVSVFLRLMERGAYTQASTPRHNKRAIDFAVENGHGRIIKQIARFEHVDKNLLELIDNPLEPSALDDYRTRLLKDNRNNGTGYLDDDTYIYEAPSSHVDFLSHHWEDQDILATWKYTISNRKVYSTYARLENMCWRTWAKSMNNIQTLSPVEINWLKDCDVTWLYGPLKSGSFDLFQSQTGTNATKIHEPKNHVTNKKSILKTGGSTMCARFNALLVPFDRAADLQARYPSLDQKYIDTLSKKLPPSSATASIDGWSRHVQFNEQVRQCIAVVDPEYEEDSNDETSGIILFGGGKKKNNKNIALLPDTSLKYAKDIEVPQAYSPSPSFFPLLDDDNDPFP